MEAAGGERQPPEASGGGDKSVESLEAVSDSTPLREPRRVVGPLCLDLFETDPRIRTKLE